MTRTDMNGIIGWIGIVGPAASLLYLLVGSEPFPGRLRIAWEIVEFAYFAIGVLAFMTLFYPPMER